MDLFPCLYRRIESYLGFSKIIWSWADPGFVGLTNYRNRGTPFKKKIQKLDMEVNIS